MGRNFRKAKNEVGNHPSHYATLTANLHVAKIRILQSRFPMLLTILIGGWAIL